MIFRIVDASTGEVLEEAPNGAEAGRRAGEINAERRAAGSEARVRVVRAEAEASEPVVFASGTTVPNYFTTNGADIPSYWEKTTVPQSGVPWRRREAGKVRPAMPWGGTSWWRENNPLWSLHYPHPSREVPGMLAYTPSEQHGKEDRQVRTTPGRYLAKFFGHVLSEGQIQHYALIWSCMYAPRELEIVSTPEGIVDVYENGPNSCMSYDADDYHSPVHPCYVYGAGDLSLAFIREQDGGEIVGRALVWPAMKVHGRIYGDCERMEDALSRAGYTHGSFEGAKLLRIEAEGTFVAPYLDPPCTNVRDTGAYLVIDQYGDIECQQTNGLAEEAGTPCEGCGDRVDDDERYSDPHGYYTYCESCYNDRYSTCHGCYETFDVEDVSCAPDGDYLCPDCYSGRFTSCEECSDEISHDDAVTCPDGDGPYCADCYGDKFAICEECHTTVEADQLDNDLCADCVQHSLSLEDC